MYNVLWTDENQDSDGADYTQYCSDGFIRFYKLTAFSTDVRDGGIKSNTKKEELSWTTKDGLKMTPSQMTPKHKECVLKIIRQRLEKAINEESARKIALYECWVAALTK